MMILLLVGGLEKPAAPSVDEVGKSRPEAAGVPKAVRAIPP
jgi:hypothetical protein